MDKESLTEKLLDLVEGRETPETWQNWWDEHETELEALLSRGEFLKLKPCRHGFQWVPVFGSQKGAIAILEKSGTAFEASNLYQERYLAELDAFCKEQERVQREKQAKFKADNPELFRRYPKFSKALAKVLDPTDEIKPAATAEQIGNQESVLDFTLPSQVREFFLLTAGINVSTGVIVELSGIFNFAVRFYNLPANPCRVAGNLVGKKGKSLDFWTREEFDRFVDTFDKTDPYYAAFMTLYYTGMRIGELQALTIADVDLKEGIIHISKTYSVIDGKEVITAPKTEKSNRDVLIPHFLCEILKEQVQRYYKVPPNTRLFQMSRQPYREQMKKHCRLAGVKKIRLHDLRHSHASLLIELGFSALLVSERLGHESVSTTLDIYAHLFPSKQVQVVERLNKLYDGTL